LLWLNAKIQFIDEITLIGGNVLPPQPVNKGVTTIGDFRTNAPALNNLIIDLEKNKQLNQIQKNAVIRALEPFARAANELEKVGVISSGAVVYAFNGATITKGDMVNAKILLKQLTQIR
jgi:hypothetical protein